jgi:glycosyltransferase involved in cell wall biosynthesis
MPDERRDLRRPSAAARVLAIGNVYPPHYLGGYEVIWQGVMGHLRRQGQAVRILATDYRSGLVGSDAPEEPDVHRELDWYWRGHEWRTLSMRDRFRLERSNAEVLDRHLAEFSPDVVTWWPLGGMSLALIERVRRRGVPAVFFVLDYWPVYGPQRDLWLNTWRPVRPIARAAERISGQITHVDYAAAGRWVFCSRSVLDATVAAHREINDITTLAPGVGSRFLSEPRDQREQRWRWRLLYVGRVVEQKGVATAIEALAQLPEGAELRIVGEGDPGYRQELERTAARLGVGSRVAFDQPRPREQLIGVYRWADAVVFPVRWEEPWGLVPLEAMALGRPVVATGRGGSGDYLLDGKNALLFASGDASALARALDALSRDPAMRARLRAGGYETAEAHAEPEFNRRAAEEIVGIVRGVRRQSSPQRRSGP